MDRYFDAFVYVANWDRAVDLLVDLRELANRSGRSTEAAKRMHELRQRHANKPSLLKGF